MQAQIWGWDGQHVVDSIPYSSGALHSWSSMGMQEEIFDKIQGYEVWGAYNTGWQWLNGNGSYIYQDRNQDILSKENPPQMYWLSGYTPPQYPGGLGITCDYDGGTSCTHGS
ncbi:MAG TPA: hypothetical protein VKV20_03445 [Ktedonobacteraceae bacterium]|nr:hypothetical protein [Ktedonobacteraceae bacterium]